MQTSNRSITDVLLLTSNDSRINRSQDTHAISEEGIQEGETHGKPTIGSKAIWSENIQCVETILKEQVMANECGIELLQKSLENIHSSTEVFKKMITDVRPTSHESLIDNEKNQCRIVEKNAKLPGTEQQALLLKGEGSVIPIHEQGAFYEKSGGRTADAENGEKDDKTMPEESSRQKTDAVPDDQHVANNEESNGGSSHAEENQGAVRADSNIEERELATSKTSNGNQKKKKRRKRKKKN
jgi:hypothetical protein